MCQDKPAHDSLAQESVSNLQIAPPSSSHTPQHGRATFSHPCLVFSTEKHRSWPNKPTSKRQQSNHQTRGFNIVDTVNLMIRNQASSVYRRADSYFVRPYPSNVAAPSDLIDKLMFVCVPQTASSPSEQECVLFPAPSVICFPWGSHFARAGKIQCSQPHD